MCFKLAFHNVRRSVKDFTVYFLTLTFGVCLFYVFNSLSSQQAMLDISQQQNELLKQGTAIIGVFSVFICVVLAFLVLYANRFLMKRRNQELGIYMTLGMERGKISRILVLETAFIGLFSLVVGLLLGIACSQGMAYVSASILGVTLKSFHFTFSVTAFWQSLVYFGLIFVLVMLFNLRTISRLKLIDLLQGGKRNEALHVKSLGVSVVLFLVSIACLGGAYAFIIHNGMIAINFEFFASLILGTIGTILFFQSLSGFLLRIIKSSKRIYYKGLNMFVLRQINSKINTTYLSMSVICIMLLITIGTVSSGVGIGNLFSKNIETTAPYDISIRAGHGQDAKQSPVEYLREHGFPFDQFVSQYTELNYYQADVLYQDLMKGGTQEIDKNQFLFGSIGNGTLPVLSLSQYNEALALQGKKPIVLAAGEYKINCTMPLFLPVYEYYTQNEKAITINGVALAPAAQPIESIGLSTSMMSEDAGTLIVRDEVMPGLELMEKQLNIMLSDSLPNVNEAFSEAFQPFLWEYYEDNDSKPFQMLSRQLMLEQSSGLKLTALYLMLYVGVVFLIASVAVLALQQLSEASDNRARYRLLQKLGVPERMITRSLIMQIAVYFMMPLGLAVIHSAVGLSVVKNVLSQMGHIDMFGSVLGAAALFLVIYGGYFLATCAGSRSMIQSGRK